MNYKIVDLENWPRKEIFNYMINVHPSKITMTKEIDITNIYNHIRRLKLKFTPTIYYCLGVIVNQLDNFKYYILKDQLVKFDKLDAMYTLFHDEAKTFSNVYTEYDNDIDVFLKNFSDDMDKYRHDYSFMSKPPKSPSIYFISNLPWTNFTNIHVEVDDKQTLLSPRFFLSRRFEKDGKVILPVTLVMNHAICDGYHIEEFFNNFQYFVNTYNPESERATNIMENVKEQVLSL